MARSRWIVNFVTSLLPFSGSAGCFAQAADPPANPFPQTVEVIPDKLRARIFLHEIQNGTNKISCWTYISDGLRAQKQKEIMFTVQRRQGEKAEDYPTGVLGLFATVYHYAEKGELVDAGGTSLLGQREFLGSKDIRGVGYTEPLPSPGVDAGNVPLLTAIMLKGDEAQIAWDFGLTRVTARLGQEYRYYPFPPWADLDREPVIRSAEMDQSVVAKLKIHSVDVQASFYLENGNIFIRVPGDSEAAADLQKHILEPPPSEPLMFRGHVDARAGACLVWVVGSKNRNAISAPGRDASRTTGAFLIMLMDRKAEEQKANRVQLIEDGAALYLTSAAWQKMREAMASGNNLVVPAAAKGEPNITLDWVKTSYTSPVTGEKVVSQGFESYKDGHFKISVPPGEYVVGVSGPASEPFPFRTTYAPSAHSFKTARVYRVADGEHAKADIFLDAPLAPRSIPVVVQWPDGRLVEDATVWLTAAEGDAKIAVDTAVGHTNADGAFTLKAVAQTDYVVHADIYTVKSGLQKHCAQDVVVRSTDQPGTVKALLDRQGSACGY